MGRACSAAAGFALDLGTTTISGSLIDLSSGDRLATGTRRNPQAAYGADVMTRLTLAVMDNKNALALRRLVLESAADLLQTLCDQASVPLDCVNSGAVVGNTAMHHLALGLDVSGLCRAPYTPACKEAGVVELPGLPPLYAPPIIASFVGSDAVSAALATNLACGAGTRLLIDVGTNTEALLRHAGKLYAASAPAGPAFEGGEISRGVQARPGAIDSVRFVGDRLEVTTIGGATPIGVCGSGLVDAVAALLKAGALDETGRLYARGPLSGQVLVGDDGGATGFAIAPGVVLTQKDIRAFQLAKGAVRTAADALLRHAGVSPSALDEVLLAGSFGTFLNAENALSTGLLPPVAESKVIPVGNAALAGAEIILSSGCTEAAELIARSAEHVELALLPGFQDGFLQSLEFHMAMPQGTR